MCRPRNPIPCPRTNCNAPSSTRTRATALHFGSEIWAIVILAAIVASGLSAKFRDWAEATSQRRFVQALIFVPLLLLTNDLLYLPANIYGQHLELKFDQSIQSWPSWLWDWTKGELILLVCAVPLALLLYAVIRRSPRRWWLYFWLATLPHHRHGYVPGADGHRAAVLSL